MSAVVIVAVVIVALIVVAAAVLVVLVVRDAGSSAHHADPVDPVVEPKQLRQHVPERIGPIRTIGTDASAVGVRCGSWGQWWPPCWWSSSW